MKLTFLLSALACSCIYLCSCHNTNIAVAESPAKIKADIENILQLQENIYGSHNEDELKKFAATCEDSLVFIGGDDGGMMVSSIAYVHDLADGYTQRPRNRSFRIYDNTVIVNSIHQGYKLFGKDTLYLNARSTKIFIRNGKEWKMAYVTYAPLPISYTKPGDSNPKNFTAYEGQYSFDASALETITVTGGKIYTSTNGSPKEELIPLNDSTFMGEGYLGKAIFNKDAAGKVTHYTFEWPDGQRLKFPKVK
jgi:hypothetical protein